MAKRVFTVALTKGTTFLHHKADKKPERVAAENWGISIAFAPESVFVISEDNDARFSPKRERILIFLNG